MSFLAELRRRNVIRMAGLYLVVAWLIVQVGETLLPIFETPAWVLKTLVVLLVLGFLPTLVFAWLYELTPEGLKRDHEVTPAESIASQTGRRMDRLIVAGLVAVVARVAADRYWPRAEKPGSEYISGREPAGATAVAAPETYSDPGFSAPPAAKSIAVLAFADLSPGKDQEYFADGIAEEILNALTRVKDLKVAGRTSSFKFKGVNEDLRVIGEQLGVAHVLEGSVRKQGDRVRITAQLVKVDDGFHVWSETFDRKLDDVFAIQDEISQAIADALSAQFMDGGAGRHEAGVDTQAYDLYLRARQSLAQRSAASIARAADLFRQATVVDPGFDAAYSGRAAALAILWIYASDPDHASNAAEAKLAAERALALDPGNAEAHSMLGYVEGFHFWNWDAARRETRRAVELAPNDAEVANFAGDIYRTLGDLDRALKWERRAIELDPLLAINHGDLGWVLLTARRCDEAIATLKRGLQADPASTPVLFGLARAYWCLGDQERTRVAVEDMARADPQAPGVADMRARLLIHAGRRDEAEAALAEFIRRAGDGAVLHYGIAQLQVMLGLHEDAARSLERAYRERDPLFPADELMCLPEDWPDHPAIRAALDKPELNALFEIRRRHYAAQGYRQTDG